jgi:hypothetical protein
VFWSLFLLNLRLKEYVFIGLLAFSNTTWAGQCSIDILNEKNSGEKIHLHFTSKLSSRRQCQELAQMHRPNFNSNQVKLKTVHYQWSGPEFKRLADSKRTHLAKSKTLKRRHLRKF